MTCGRVGRSRSAAERRGGSPASSPASGQAAEIGPAKYGGAAFGRAEGAGHAEAQPPLPGCGPRVGQIGQPAGPRTWRQCCAPSPAMVAVHSTDASDERSCRACRCQRATLLGSLISRSAAARYSGERLAWASSAARWARSVPSSPRVIGRSGRHGCRAHGRFRACLDQRPIDRPAPGLVQAGHPAELGDRVESATNPPAARTAAA